MWHIIIYLFLIFSQFYIVSSQEENQIFEEFACENNTNVHFDCDYSNQYSDLFQEPRKKIQIVDGFYGRDENTNCVPRKKGKLILAKSSNCTLDIADFMRKRCDGLERCDYNSTNDFFGGNPCIGDPKYTTIHYQCVAPEETTTEAATEPPEAVVDGPTICFSRTIRIQCAKKKIKVKKVFFGRTDDTTCIPSSVKNKFGNNLNYKCDGSDVALKYTKKLCDGKSTCDLINAVGTGDGIMNSGCNAAQVPYLRISHSCV
ncbi:unnamed protein product [Brassicogethes aeneus]|uniref:SUEL-type lectin domain-containing protein n=1 Tax=Brassicogethes aeneus TaxID=1431903 RepID=A0A9P0BIP2_BRAAE|nr:unnamed protein product [Brassicogethes aeneus]